VLLLDYQLIQPGLVTEDESQALLSYLLAGDIAALVMITSSTEGNGKYIGGGRALENLPVESFPPIVYIRLEDLGESGIGSWDDLNKVNAVAVTWDADVLLPGISGNLIVKIPGRDPANALVLGAHVDSANNPGAIDNGINSAVLIEVARILDQAQIQPAVDLYLVWFGSEEIWMYGSQHFVNTHQDILDRALATISMDGITDSTPGYVFFLEEWSHSQWGQRGTPVVNPKLWTDS